MTLSPDTADADLAAPDPADYRRRRKAAGLPLTVWALIAFGLGCVLTGIVIALYGPKLFPVRPTAAVTPPPAIQTAAPPSAVAEPAASANAPPPVTEVPDVA